MANTSAARLLLPTILCTVVAAQQGWKERLDEAESNPETIEPRAWQIEAIDYLLAEARKGQRRGSIAGQVAGRVIDWHRLALSPLRLEEISAQACGWARTGGADTLGAGLDVVVACQLPWNACTFATDAVDRYLQGVSQDEHQRFESVIQNMCGVPELRPCVLWKLLQLDMTNERHRQLAKRIFYPHGDMDMGAMGELAVAELLGKYAAKTETMLFYAVLLARDTPQGGAWSESRLEMLLTAATSGHASCAALAMSVLRDVDIAKVRPLLLNRVSGQDVSTAIMAGQVLLSLSSDVEDRDATMQAADRSHSIAVRRTLQTLRSALARKS